jgi:hypothetical protein
LKRQRLVIVIELELRLATTAPLPRLFPCERLCELLDCCKKEETCLSCSAQLAFKLRSHHAFQISERQHRELPCCDLKLFHDLCLRH